jgi:hypothetical protein
MGFHVVISRQGIQDNLFGLPLKQYKCREQYEQENTPRPQDPDRIVQTHEINLEHTASTPTVRKQKQSFESNQMSAQADTKNFNARVLGMHFLAVFLLH